MNKGIFIVFDGNDGSGKATQSKLLAESLAQKGISAEKVDFPAYDRNFFGAFVGECLVGKHGDFLHMDPKIASSLYALDRLESAPLISNCIEQGTVVLADRYASSNQIHQGGKIENEEERGEFLAWLDRMEHDVLNIPRPDAIIYLRVPLETSLALLSEKRTAKNQLLGEGERDMVEEDRAYLERSIATAEWLLTHQPNWHVVDCMKEGALRSRENIHEEIAGIVAKLISEHSKSGR